MCTKNCNPALKEVGGKREGQGNRGRETERGESDREGGRNDREGEVFPVSIALIIPVS